MREECNRNVSLLFSALRKEKERVSFVINKIYEINLGFVK